MRPHWSSKSTIHNLLCFDPSETSTHSNFLFCHQMQKTLLWKGSCDSNESTQIISLSYNQLFHVIWHHHWIGYFITFTGSTHRQRRGDDTGPSLSHFSFCLPCGFGESVVKLAVAGSPWYGSKISIIWYSCPQVIFFPQVCTGSSDSHLTIRIWKKMVECFFWN